ncbi:hypothetical protein NFHkm12_15730 [Latilactobacillus curvatus]|uniref:hypothetical protein n=1 Tax=Latilactobacillus curvatus TaxID=28038 RepID=UPI000DBB95B7|nr:hypothetical protein [Latilactobacillus curvatus]WBY48583.1 hypothetical protein PGA57_07995 [Latilactobacillus curvatus]BBE26747.1 hypothetical protein NFHkm12_15730 [Latilactobacillus curvatus]
MQIITFVISLLAFIMSSILFVTKIYDRFMTPIIEITDIYPAGDIFYIKISVLNRSSSPIAVTHVLLQNHEATSYPHMMLKSGEHKVFGDPIPSNIPQKSIIQFLIAIPIDTQELEELLKKEKFILNVTTSMGKQHVITEIDKKLRTLDQLVKEQIQ